MDVAGGIDERVRVGAKRRDGDLAWLGLLLSVASAFLMVGLVWWLVT